MTSLAFVEERVMFSPNMPAEVNGLLQAAVAASSVDQSRAETLFLQAQALDSHCLQTFINFIFIKNALLMQNEWLEPVWRKLQGKAVSLATIADWLKTGKNGIYTPTRSLYSIYTHSKPWPLLS